MKVKYFSTITLLKILELLLASKEIIALHGKVLILKRAFRRRVLLYSRALLYSESVLLT